MTRRFRISPEAEQQLVELHDYIAEHGDFLEIIGVLYGGRDYEALLADD